MIVNLLKILFVCCLLFLNSDLGAKNFNSESKVDFSLIKIKSSPSQKDWRFFMNMSDSARQKLWQQNSKNKAQLQTWSWQWRLGWISKCMSIKVKPCKKIIAQGLNDRALVVRAATITKLGVLYSQTNNTKVLKKIVKQFYNKNNFKNNKPLFVLRRALVAIHSISSKLGLKITKKLSKKYPKLQKYRADILRINQLYK